MIANKIDNNDRSFDIPDQYEWLHVYKVDSTGSVNFVTKFCVQNNYAMVYNEFEFYAPPNLLLASK